jgi:hypothetical protein
MGDHGLASDRVFDEFVGREVPAQGVHDDIGDRTQLGQRARKVGVQILGAVSDKCAQHPIEPNRR